LLQKRSARQSAVGMKVHRIITPLALIFLTGLFALAADSAHAQSGEWQDWTAARYYWDLDKEARGKDRDRNAKVRALLGLSAQVVQSVEASLTPPLAGFQPSTQPPISAPTISRREGLRPEPGKLDRRREDALRAKEEAARRRQIEKDESRRAREDAKRQRAADKAERKRRQAQDKRTRAEEDRARRAEEKLAREEARRAKAEEKVRLAEEARRRKADQKLAAEQERRRAAEEARLAAEQEKAAIAAAKKKKAEEIKRQKALKKKLLEDDKKNKHGQIVDDELDELMDEELE